MAKPALPELYDSDFFTHLQQGSRRSAAIIAPLVLDWTAPKSVVDVGCGVSVFQACGVDDVLGLDGSYVQPKTLQISQECFVPKDLNQPFVLDRRFDLAPWYAQTGIAIPSTFKQQVPATGQLQLI